MYEQTNFTASQYELLRMHPVALTCIYCTNNVWRPGLRAAEMTVIQRLHWWVKQGCSWRVLFSKPCCWTYGTRSLSDPNYWEKSKNWEAEKSQILSFDPHWKLCRGKAAPFCHVIQFAKCDIYNFSWSSFFFFLLFKAGSPLFLWGVLTAPL